MTKRKRDPAQIEAWRLDQLAKSIFFHRKLHEWALIEIADAIDAVQGEHLDWQHLDISDAAWNKIIHSGIKPVVIFAHPHVLQTVQKSAAYYRMLAMVSQKSMKWVGFSLAAYETGKSMPDDDTAFEIARHLNRIINRLIEADEKIDVREFDLWRGMAAGSQAQGSWQNNKGVAAEIAVRDLIIRRLQVQEIITDAEVNESRFTLDDNRVMLFADEPDIAIYRDDVPEVAIEVKGGIDTAGVLERIGAALKSLQRTRQENPDSVTILIIPDVSMTERARHDLSLSADTVTHLFRTHEILDDESQRDRFFEILGI